jgi:hypothetical protein
MSYANFGPTYRSESVVNQEVAAVAIPTSLVNAAIVTTNLIRLADGITEIQLTLPAGEYIFRGKCFLSLPAGAVDVQYAQAVLINLTTNDIIASSAAITGASFAGGQANVRVAMNVDVISSVAAATSFALRLRSNGVTVACAMGIPGGQFNSTLRATRISA